MPLPNTSRELSVASGSGSNGMAAPHRNSAAPLPNGIQASHHPSRDQPAHPSSQPSFLQGQGSLPHIIQQILQIGHSSTVQAAQMSGLGLGGPTTSARASGPFATSALSKLDKETEACWLQAGESVFFSLDGHHALTICIFNSQGEQQNHWATGTKPLRATRRHSVIRRTTKKLSRKQQASSGNRKNSLKLSSSLPALWPTMTELVMFGER